MLELNTYFYNFVIEMFLVDNLASLECISFLCRLFVATNVVCSRVLIYIHLYKNYPNELY